MHSRYTFMREATGFPGFEISRRPREGGGWDQTETGAHFADRLRLRDNESITLTRESMSWKSRAEYRELWDAFYRWFRGSFRLRAVKIFQDYPWLRMVQQLLAGEVSDKKLKFTRMHRRRRTAQPCIEACSAMVSDKCHGQCEHMCSTVPYGIAGVFQVGPQPMHGHLGKHICVACFQFLSVDEAGKAKVKEMRQAVFRRMAGTASQINSAAARQVGLLAQMVELEWPRVEDHCDPVLVLDTSDEEDERTRLDSRDTLPS